MRSPLAEIAFAVFRQGADLRRRREHGLAARFADEGARLHEILWPADSAAAASMDFDATADSPTLFLGPRYAMTCWLDELLAAEGVWPEQALEEMIFGTVDGPWKFWEQALPEQETDGEALEVFFLCVALGFRGELDRTPERLQEWFASTRARLEKRPAGWTPPPTLDPAQVGPRPKRWWPSRLFRAALMFQLLPAALGLCLSGGFFPQ